MSHHLSSTIASVCLLLGWAATASAGIGLHYHGSPGKASQPFQFEVTSTSPASLGTTPDNPMSSTSEFGSDESFSDESDFRSLFPFFGFRIPSFREGGGGPGGLGGTTFASIQRRSNHFASSASSNAASRNSSSSGGGGGDTSDGSLAVNDTDKMGRDADPQGPDQGMGPDGRAGENLVDGGSVGSPSPSAVPEPGTFVFWSIAMLLTVGITRKQSR
jgi:hypothetical protein